jgi:hypothetical protein
MTYKRRRPETGEVMQLRDGDTYQSRNNPAGDGGKCHHRTNSSGHPAAGGTP